MPLFDSPKIFLQEDPDMAKTYSWWDDRRNNPMTITRDVEKEKKEENIFETPKSIYNYFDSQLFGCEEYKKAMATAVWSALKLRTKTNFLVIGPSGCGKTELARIFAKVYYNTTIFDATSATPVSYKGNVTISESLLQVDTSENAQPPWVFIDEVDKAILKDNECGPMIMNELLKMTEGGKLYVGRDERHRELVDTSKVNFVFLGTFSALKKERKNSIGFSAGTEIVSKSSPITRNSLHESGLISDEFLGRINGGILEVEPMDEIKAAKLLEDERYSPIKRLEKMYRVNIEVTEEKRHELVAMTSKYGVRGIYSELQSRINDAIFEDCTVKDIII